MSKVLLICLFSTWSAVIALESDSKSVNFYIIVCTELFIHIDCVPRDCLDILKQSQLQKKSVCSGIYTIKPDNKPPFKVTTH